MACLAAEDVAASRLCTATCVAGGTITQLLRASGKAGMATAPKGDLLLAAALSAAAAQATHFQTTKRPSAQRRDLIRQADGSRSYMQQAAALSSMAERVHCEGVFSSAASGPVVHNLRDSRRGAPQQHQAPVCGPAGGNDSWYFNLALQSSLL